MATVDKRIALDKEFSLSTVKLIHYFARNTIEKIFKHIDKLDVRDTDALRNSIRSVVHTNASGSQALVEFFYLYYGECVEQAVGKYYGIDADLGKDRGVRSENIKAPEIASRDYGPLSASFSGVPKNVRREQTHRPRPFLRSDIRREVEYTGWRLANKGGQLIEMHMVIGINDLLSESIHDLIMAPFGGRKNMTFTPIKNEDGKIETMSEQGWNP